MAYNPSPKVADCRAIARKWNRQIVIILAVDVNEQSLEYASYGETKELCDTAKVLADEAYNSIVDMYANPP